MQEKLSRDELLELVQMIMSMKDKDGRVLGDEEHHELVIKFENGINHPDGTDLIYYPELVGLPKEPTVEEIVDLALKGV